MHGNKTNLFSSAKAMIPKPEFYVVYTGNRKNLPEFMQLSSHFKHLQRDEDPALQLKLKVLYTSQEGDILYQYLMFCKVLAEQYERAEGDLMEAIKNTVEICKDQGYLKDYFEEHESEASKTMFRLLYDETLNMELHDAQLARQTAQQIALKLLDSGIDDETIMQATQLTASQLADLREQGENALRIC